MERIVDHVRVPAGENWREVLYAHQIQHKVGKLEMLVSKSTLKSDKVKLADPRIPKEKELIDMVADLCEARGIAHIPRIAVAHSHIPNAMSVQGQVVIFSTDIKQTMDHDELKAIVGHELSHHRHTLRDGVINMGTMGAVWQGVSMASKPLYAKLPEGILGSIGGQLLGRFIHPVGAILGVWATTPWRRYMEVEADKEGAELTSPEHMKNAFIKLDARVAQMKETEEAPRTLVSKIQHFIMEPMSIHPKTKDRVKAMEKMAAEQQNQR